MGWDTFGIGSCTKLAVELENSGKKAEAAVVIRSWIGGHQIHFIIARPVITRIGDRYELQCVLSCPDELKFDLLTPIESSESSSGDESLSLPDIPVVEEHDAGSEFVEDVEMHYETEQEEYYEAQPNIEDFF